MDEMAIEELNQKKILTFLSPIHSGSQDLSTDELLRMVSSSIEMMQTMIGWHKISLIRQKKYCLIESNFDRAIKELVAREDV